MAVATPATVPVIATQRGTLVACPKVYNAKPAGYGLIIGGAAIAGGFGAIVLPIVESRDRRARGAQVMVSYTLRF